MQIFQKVEKLQGFSQRHVTDKWKWIKLLTALARKFIVQLMRIVNAVFRLQHFSSQGKNAVVITILKPGKIRLIQTPIDLYHSLISSPS